MIPSTIKREDIQKALVYIGQNGVPETRKSKRYCLSEDRHYPPKYVVSIAHELATGTRLDWKQFNGGCGPGDCNDFLKGLGFTVVCCPHRCGGTP